MKHRTAYVLLFLAAVCLVGSPKDKNARQAVESKDAPKVIGPYSQAIKAGNFVFCAGQIPIDPATGQLVQGDISAQTDRVLKNLSGVLAAAGTDLDHAVKTTVFLKNISDFAVMNEVYAHYFKGAPPARSTIGGVQLARDALVEIEVVAVLPSK